MRRNSSFSILFVVILLMNSQTSLAHNNSVKSTTTNHSKEKMITSPEESKVSDLPIPVAPVTKTEEHAKKIHLLKIDELAHIHHFHKERVKKLKRHHKKCWAMSKLLIVLSHLVLLISAYLHYA